MSPVTGTDAFTTCECARPGSNRPDDVAGHGHGRLHHLRMRAAGLEPATLAL
jgi:hypothetical protein